MTAIDSFFGKSSDGCSQPHLLTLLGKEPEGPSPMGGGVKDSCDLGGNGHTPIKGDHHPSFTEVVRATGKTNVLMGKGKEMQVLDPTGKA